MASQGLALFMLSHGLALFMLSHGLALIYVVPGSCSLFVTFFLDITPLYVFPYADQIHCVFTLIMCALHSCLLHIPLVGGVLYCIITWQCL